MISYGIWRLYWFYEPPEPSDDWIDPVHLFPEGWLRSFRDRSVLLPALKRLLLESGVELSRVSDDVVFKHVARRLESGQICIQQRRWRDESHKPQGDGDRETEPPFPRAERTPPKSSSVVPNSEENVFPNDADLAAIADALKKASQAGVPFCEECAKAAAAAGNKQ